VGKSVMKLINWLAQFRREKCFLDVALSEFKYEMCILEKNNVKLKNEQSG
jgi:hypothetical protein